MTAVHIPPRTFGDLKRRALLVGSCRFCKQWGLEVRKYSDRHYICDPCIEPRKDVVLPSVQRRERFDAKLRQIRERAQP